jgi:hypothetical protein
MNRIIKIVALAATALFATAAVASAAVSYDDSRVGHVDKGDVQALFGWNDAELQANAKSIKFTNKLVSVKDTSWTCSNDSTQHSIFTVTSVRPLDVTPLTNKQGKVTDWTLNGLSKTDFGTATGAGDRFPSYACPAGSYFTGLNVSQTATSMVQVNGTDLPNTPVAVPAV